MPNIILAVNVLSANRTRIAILVRADIGHPARLVIPLQEQLLILVINVGLQAAEHVTNAKINVPEIRVQQDVIQI